MAVIWHPLALTIWVMDALSGFLAIAIVVRLLAAIPSWNPLSPDRKQLARERSLELVLYQGRWLFALQLLTLALLILGISNLWTEMIPGAMCGTGVLQAMGTAGNQTLIFRTIAVLILAAWHAAAWICHRSPAILLWPVVGRALIPALPMIALATIAWGHALSAIAPDTAVHCCALVYAAAGADLATTAPTAEIGHLWLFGAVTGAVILAGLAIIQRRAWPTHGTAIPLAITVGTLAWSVVAAIAIRDGVAPYVYEVLAHRCPWCLFLTDHGGLGLIFFGSVFLVVMEQLAALVAHLMARHDKMTRAPAHTRARIAHGRVAAAAIVFAVAGSVPPIAWRVTFGQWLM